MLRHFLIYVTMLPLEEIGRFHCIGGHTRVRKTKNLLIAHIQENLIPLSELISYRIYDYCLSFRHRSYHQMPSERNSSEEGTETRRRVTSLLLNNMKLLNLACFCIFLLRRRCRGYF